MDLRDAPIQTSEAAVEQQPSAEQFPVAEVVEETKKIEANSCIIDGIAAAKAAPNTDLPMTLLADEPTNQMKEITESGPGVVAAMEVQTAQGASAISHDVMMEAIDTSTATSDRVSQIEQKDDELRVVMDAPTLTNSPLCNNAGGPSVDISIPNNVNESSSTMQPSMEVDDSNLVAESTQDGVIGKVSDDQVESSDSDSDSDVNETDLSGVIDKSLLDKFMADESSNVSDVLRTANEQDASKLPIPDRMSMLIPDTDSLPLAGSILSIVEGTIVIMCSPGALAVDIGSAFALSNRIPLGWVDEVFGPVDAPLYTIRIADDHGISPEHLAPGKNVFYVEKLSSVVKPSMLDSKGTDASGLHDEPVLHEVDFSDDEEERLYKKSKKKPNSRSSGRASQSESAGDFRESSRPIRRSPPARGSGRGRGRGRQHHHQQERGRDHAEMQRHEYGAGFYPERHGPPPPPTAHLSQEGVPLMQFRQMSPFLPQEYYGQRPPTSPSGSALVYYMRPPPPQMMDDARRFQPAGNDQRHREAPPQFEDERHQ